MKLFEEVEEVVMVITTQKVIGNRLLGQVISNHSLILVK